MHEGVKRIFFAVKIYPDDLFRQTLNELRILLTQEQIRWIKEENFHLTLRFLGETEIEKIHQILEGLAHFGCTISDFELDIRGLGVFRSYSFPRVVWAGVKENEELTFLKKSLDYKLSAWIAPEAREFAPHLSLGRMKRVKNRDSFRNSLEGLRNRIYLKQWVESLVLFESVLGSQGPEYIPLKEFFFSKPRGH